MVSAESHGDALPLEFLNLPSASHGAIDDALPILVQISHELTHVRARGIGYRDKIHGESTGDNWGTIGSPSPKERLKAWGFRNEIHDTAKKRLAASLLNHRSLPAERQQHVLARASEMSPECRPSDHTRDHARNPETVVESPHVETKTVDSEATICFATHGSHGILDLGASKTVIGSDHVAELIQSLDDDARQRLSRCPCSITFRFGNQGTLSSKQALVIPIGPLQLKVAIVPGGTPFLISNTLMRAIEARIDCASQTVNSPLLKTPVPLQLTPKGLFLIDVNQLIKSAQGKPSGRDKSGTRQCAETFMSDETEAKRVADQIQPVNAKIQKPTTEITKNNKSDTNHNLNSPRRPMHKANQTVTDSKEAENHDSSIRVQKQVTVQSAEDPTRDQTHGVVVAAPTIVADPSLSDAREPGSPATGRPGERNHLVRPETSGSLLSGGMAGPGMGPFHVGPLPELNEGKPSKIPEVCGTPSRGDGEFSDGLAATTDLKSGKPSQGQAQARSQDHGHTVSHLFAGWGRRLGCGVRDVHPSDYGLCHQPHDRGSHSLADPDVEHGKCVDARDQAHRGPGLAEQCQPGERDGLRDPWNSDKPASMPANVEGLESEIKGIKEDWDNHVFTSMSSETSELWRLVGQITSEMQDVLQQTKPMGSRWTLGEVMCSSKSPITQQVLNSGQQAFRFGLDQGDLSTSAGRCLLFRKIAQHRPRHVWYSPTCGPWSSWSQLNAARSMQHQQEYNQMRKDLLYQIALGIVLYRHQIVHKSHFHWEQPQKSLMFHCPNLSEIQEHTRACQFDMCRAGALVDPENKMPMKKGMTVLTTNELFYKRFHGVVCDHRHQHQPIEGSCRMSKGEKVLRSKYTEVYPRKFARAVAQVMTKGSMCLPYGWNSELSAYSAQLEDQASPVMAIQTKFRSKQKFPLSEIVSPHARADADAKRSKTDLHQGIAPTLETCQQAIQAVSEVLPRVGKKEVHEPQIMSMLQQIFPDKHIRTAIACRGTERTMEPPKTLHAQEAPYRRMLMLRRDGGIRYEKNWEKWTELSKRQLIRPSHACRVNVTVFAKGFESNEQQLSPERPIPEEPSVPEQKESRSVQEPPPQEVSTSSDQVPAGESSGNQVPVPPSAESESPFGKPGASTEGGANTPPLVPENTSLDPVLEQQSQRFRSLPKWEQQMILKLHKNLGHPSNDRLARALQVNGSRPEVIQAASEIRCTACAAHAPPKHARPATLKAMIDFNHKVYLDGIKWTNSQGKSYHLFHMLDAGTNYHVAIASPARTSQDLIQVLSQYWLSWAGPPSELVVDSGTEMNSQEFSEFAQRFNIRLTTTAPEAHWQSGKIERHGAFLQSMLSKVDLEHPVSSYADLQIALNQCTHAKNSLSIRQGYAPEVIVFGKHSRLPGSILSDESVPSHEQALQEENSISPAAFRQTLAIRESARRAFHTADNCNALRRALLRRACPTRGHYVKGEWVMTWKNGPLNQHRWCGPHRVILQENHHTVWCTSGGKLIRSAPENTRRAFPEEGSPEGPELPEDITPMTQQIARMKQQVQLEDNPENESPEINTEIIPSNINPNPEHNNPSNQPDNNSESQEESIPQPDQEPENITPEESRNETSEDLDGEPSGQDGPDASDPMLLTCHELENAFSCADAGNLAWSCEFDMRLEAPLETHMPSEEESWLLLATASKKQRSEVKLSNLSDAELKEFQSAKQAEVENWIKTGTISAILRNQIPEEQI